MIPQTIIDEILDLDIADVISREITLERKGVNWRACCPFHKEATPSFSVSSAKAIFKCFGCGESGNSVTFIMKHKTMDYPSALKYIASEFKIIIPEEKQTDVQKALAKKRDEVFAANKFAADFFQANLQDPKHSKAMDYARGRWNDEIIEAFSIGFAPDSWKELKEKAAEQGIKDETLLRTGLISKSDKGTMFDYFRNRIIFPYYTRSGRIIGFTGRDISGIKDTPKYFNTKETDVFSKGKNLYGINNAKLSIQNKGFAYLVEGNADVVKLHQIEIHNTVGSCGTALTREQISLLKKETSSVTLIGDSDAAGKLAVIKSGKLIIENGMYCNVITLPSEEPIIEATTENVIPAVDTLEEAKMELKEGKVTRKKKPVKEIASPEENKAEAPKMKPVKHDPDSFFYSKQQFVDYANENNLDFIFFLADTKAPECKTPDKKSKLVDELALLISKLPESSWEIYTDRLCKLIGNKKMWQDALKAFSADKREKNAGKRWVIPQDVKLDDAEMYGFYRSKECYFFKGTNGDYHRGSNFIMEPLFHIRSVINSKRIYKIINEFGASQLIELAQRDLISLGAFRLRVESLGNFLFEGTEVDLMRLKRYLYEKTLVADEITQLGWQKQGFWAWSNGILNGEFQKTDAFGIVKFGKDNFYLPSSSDIFKTEDTLYVSETSYKHTPAKITLNDFSKKMLQVYGDNAIFGMCFFFASLFRDHIFKIFKFFPILNLFGPKGAGKSEMAVSLMNFFGTQSAGPVITNTSLPALGSHVASYCNGLVHIDEYTNALDIDKVEWLKAIWMGVGRARMNMEKDKKMESVAVMVAMMLSGQQMPTADIALYTRLIFLAFMKVEFTAKEKIHFTELKAIEALGLTHITHELLQHRDEIILKYVDSYEKVSFDLLKELGPEIIEDRIFRNWLVMIAAFHCLEHLIEVPFTYEEVIKKAAKLIVRQNQETKKGNELSIFWSIVEFLTNDGRIKEGVDFRIEPETKLKTDKVDTDWDSPKQVIYINHSRLFELYSVHGKQASRNILPTKTIEYYLMNCKEYLGRKHNVAFKVEVDKKIVEDKIVPDISTKEKKTITRRVTNAMAFDYEALNISIHNVTTIVEGDSVSSSEPF